MTDSLRVKIEEAAEELSAFLEECPMITEENRAGYRSRMAEIRRSIQAADRPLRLALLGGTGVGKSTIINALAGKEISRGSRRRPTTTQLVVYAHKDWEGGSGLVLDANGQVSHHEEPSIRDLLIIDFPDFDSLREEGRETVDEFLPKMDQILWVVDKEKYNDRRLHADYIRQEAPYRQNFLFLFNKVDDFSGGEADLEICVDDLLETLAAEGIDSPVLFRISAKDALEQKGGKKGDPIGEFDLFEDHLRSRYTEKYREEIRRANVVKALGTLAAEIGGDLRAEEVEGRIGNIRTVLEAAERYLGEAGRRHILDEALSYERRRSIAGIFQQRYAHDLPGLVGMMAEWRIFGRLGPSPHDIRTGGKGPIELLGGLLSLFDGGEESGGARRFHTALANAAHEVRDGLRGLGVERAPVQTIGMGEREYEERLEETYAGIKAKAQIAAEDHPFRRRGKFSQHILPWAVALSIAGFSVWFNDALRREGALHWVLLEIPVALIVIYVAEAALARRAVRHEAWERADALREILEKSLDDLVKGALVRPAEQEIASVEAIYTRWRAVESRIEGIKATP
ncbi:MAG: 50S ribosome-binding GTPase [Planctomycetota bacterium]|nr:50S ribosome-binding GTPase [Planctomycetota bacterium]